MIGRIALAALLLTSAPAIAQVSAEPAAAAPAAPAPKPATVQVTLTTALGPIVLELEKERAPVSTANFLKYVDQKKYDGIGFYRAVNIAEGYGLVQSGIRSDARKLNPPIAHETTSQTGLSHVDGAVSWARGAPGTAQSDFFIVVGNLPAMDADASKPGDNLGYAVFGRVVEGMGVVKQILAAPISPTAGEGMMRGQMLAEPVKIVSARRTDPTPMSQR